MPRRADLVTHVFDDQSLDESMDDWLSKQRLPPQAPEHNPRAERIIEELLGHLTTNQRECVEMYLGRGIRQAEVGAMLWPDDDPRKREDRVQGAASRGLKKLREIVAADLDRYELALAY